MVYLDMKTVTENTSLDTANNLDTVYYEVIVV